MRTGKLRVGRQILECAAIEPFRLRGITMELSAVLKPAE